MPPKKTTDADGNICGLTPAENKFIKTMFDNMKTRPDADWDNVASQMNLKDAKCAKERFRQIAARHGWNSKGSGGDAGGSPFKVAKKPAGTTGGGRKKGAAAAKKPKKENEDDDDELVKDEEEPTKMPKKEARGRKAVKDEESGTESDNVKDEDKMELS